MAKQRISNYVFLPGVSKSSNAYPNAYELISQNKGFIQAEVVAYINQQIALDNATNLYPEAVRLLTDNKAWIIDEIIAWVAARVASGVSPWVGYTYNQESCRRDTGYLIDAYIYDLRYGGNEKTIEFCEALWQGGSAQLISPTQEVLGFQQIATIITNFVFPRNLYSTEQSPVKTTQNRLGSSAEPNAASVITNLAQLVTNVIPAGLSVLPAKTYSVKNFAGYIYDSQKCYRDVGLVIDAYLNDLRYGGNAQTRYISSRFWRGAFPQLSGDRKPEITAQTWIKELITNTILPQTAYTPIQTSVPRYTNLNITFEGPSTARISSLATSFIAVLTNGLSSLPALTNGATTIRLQGKYDLDKLLLITNTTRNQILYNFSDPTQPAAVDISTGYVSNDYWQDDDFQSFRNTADYVTTIVLDVDTSSHSLADDIQIFVEEKEMKVRPYDFGTDAIERHRVAQAQSMLDADFEYGLQPTKWQAIGISRGYPSVYEIPGSDIPVVIVQSDASASSSGVGGSLITVTTSGSHGLTPGTPITIKGLLNTVTGFSRAEGTFVVESAPSSTQFTYYAISKVGTTNPSTLATTYTQLRKGAFYTGASVGVPSFGVYTNGLSISFTSKLITPLASDQMAFTGTVPSIGAPISGTGMSTGAQVTGVVGDGSSSGIIKSLETSASAGSTSIVVNDASSILEGMAINNGSGVATFVAGISGTTINLTTPLAASLLGNTQTYSSLSGTSIQTSGTGAIFSVTRSAGTYTNLSITSGGSGYAVGDLVKVPGTLLGGTAPTNDLIISVGTVDGTGAITTVSIAAGVASSGNATYTAVDPTSTTSPAVISYNGVAQNSSTGSGTAATFNVNRSRNGYAVTLVNRGSGYATGEILTINGAALGGATPSNNLSITVTELLESYTNVVPSATSGSGQGVLFNVTRTGAVYTSVSLVSGGNNFLPNDTITIAGTLLGGASPANDLAIQVQTTRKVFNNITQDSSSGTGLGAKFVVTVNNTSTTYNVTVPVDQSGVGGYQVGDTITIVGTRLGGTSPANDLVLTVTGLIAGTSYVSAVSVSGTASLTDQQVVTFTFTGTAATTSGGIGTFSFTGTALKPPSSGTGAKFNVDRTGGLYNVTLNTAGSGYAVDDQLIISGTSLGGQNLTNDLTITITAVSSGAITAFTSSGTASSGDANYSSLNAVAYVSQGTNGKFNVTRSNNLYSVTIATAGSGYIVGEKFLVLGTDLGGSAPINNAVIVISQLSETGIAAATVSGTSVGGDTVTFYSGISFSEVTTAQIPDGTTILASAIAVIEVSFPTPHGLLPGTGILVDISSNGSNHTLAKGPFYVETVPSPTILRYTARAPGTISTATPVVGTIYSRPDSYFIHRPYDGGVQLGTGGPQHGAQAIRMSKKYIRYQSGKGVNYCTGAMFCPSFGIQKITAAGTVIGSAITITLDDVDHGCQVGGVIRISGVETKGYNGTYTVADVINERNLVVQATSTLASTLVAISTNAQLSVVKWHGATVRAGTFDDQNGLFFQYDGQNFGVGRRSATFQLTGFVDIARDTNLMTGTNTRFRDQVHAGDKIVIKGMTHVVTNVISQTQMTVNPDYRGASNAVQAKVCLVQDFIIPQSQFNLDKLDGTGPSGYNVDLTKMQMIGMQWSWYAVGFIDFMLRGSDGNFIFFHRIRNSNVNTEAYMRSGNLPVRYEVVNESAKNYLLNSVTATQNTLPLADASSFPNEAGIVIVDSELIAYSGKSGNTLVGCTRSAPMTNFTGGAQRTFRGSVAATHELNTGVILISNTISPIISHWGSAMLTDGLFDEDRGYLFGYTATGISVTTTKTTAFLLRLAPSVSNAIIGDLGERELLNRAQLLLSQVEITSDGITSGATPTTVTGGIVVEGVLNPQNYPTNPADISWGGLSGLAQGGQPSFAQIAPGGSVNWTSGGSQTTANAIALSPVNGNITVPAGSAFNRPSGTSIAYVTQSSWNSLGAATGFLVNDPKFPSGTTVNNIVSSPNPVATIQGQLYGGAFLFNQLFVGQNQANFTKSSWESMTNPVNATGLYINSSNYFPTGTRVTAVSSLQGSGSNQYYTVTFSANATSNPGSGTYIGFSIGGTYTNTSILYFTSNSWNALPLGVSQTGTTTNDTKFASGTTITAINSRVFGGTTYYAVTFSNSTGTISGGQTVTFSNTPYYTLTFSRSSTSAINGGDNIQLTLQQATTNTNFVYFTQASWETLVSTYQAASGSELNDPKFPAGTRVASISALRTFSTVPYYTVTFTQTSNTVIAGTNTVTFKFGAPPYALPGETVFSFIANPGERASLDLSKLKELTNTVLGGRGTYPNGPDVLAINVYKISGSTTTANVIIRWGEAQA